MQDNKHEQLLLLGNGINRAFGADSWNELLDEFKSPDGKNDGKNLPAPLRVIFLSMDNVGPVLKEIQNNPDKKYLLYGDLQESEQMNMLQNILSIGFDGILTTNYSYELESASLNIFHCAGDETLSKSRKHTGGVKRAESKYLLHTYNEVSLNGITNYIWHIHGEARRSDSIILGNYYYASLLFKYKELLDKKERFINTRIPSILNDSWLESFICSDVYILGFGFDPSELDLWWLLNRRKIENKDKDAGRILYYSPDNDDGKDAPGSFRDKVELMRYFGIEFCNLGIDCKHSGHFSDNVDDFYREFYKKAIEDISDKVSNARR